MTAVFDVSALLRIMGSAKDVALGGIDDELLAEVGAAQGPAERVVVSFNPDDDADIVFSRSGLAEDVTSPGARVVATSAHGTWRRAPWPVRDELFDLAEASDPTALLVVGHDPERIEAVARAAAGATAESASELTRDGIETAAFVVFVGDTGGPFPPQLFAAAAARRLVVMTPIDPGFGLRYGIDHLASKDDGALGRYASEAARHPDAFRDIRTWGRLAAECHRASVVYPRMLADVRLGV